MNRVRTSTVRTILLAAIAALCLLTFGATPHSTSAPAGVGMGAAGVSSQLQATDHHNSEIVARTLAPSGFAELSALPAADLAAAALKLGAVGVLLALLLIGCRTAVRYRTGPAPARAPPLAG